MSRIKTALLPAAVLLAVSLASCVQPYPAPKNAGEQSAEKPPQSAQKDGAELPRALLDYYYAARIEQYAAITNTDQTLLDYYYKSETGATRVEEMEQHNAKISALIEGGKANVNAADIWGRQPLLIAVQANDSDMVLRLCRAGADYNAHTVHNTPLLTTALQEGALEGAKALLNCGANPNTAGSPLTIAVLGGITSDEYRSAAIALLDKGADPNKGSIGSHTLLIYAIKTAQSDLAVKMVNSGAAISAADDNAMTPLSWALLMRDDRTADALLARGAKSDQADAYGYTPISWAILTDNNQAVSKIASSNWQPRDDDRGVMAAEIAKSRSLSELRAMLGGSQMISDPALPNIIAFSEMSFLRIEYLGNTMKFKTKDNLRKSYMMENPSRLVMDFDRSQGAFPRAITLSDGGAFLRVTTGKHDGFYRVVVHLNRTYGYNLVREPEGFVVALK